jgi:hypothetical protein
MEEILDEEIGKKEASRLRLQGCKTYSRAVAIAAMRRAIGGDINALRLILEHVEGKPIERLRVEGDFGDPVQIQPVNNLSREEVMKNIRKITERLRSEKPHP